MNEMPDHINVTRKGGSELKKPYIPPETKKAMAQFFLRTSIPRLIEKRKKEKEAL